MPVTRSNCTKKSNTDYFYDYTVLRLWGLENSSQDRRLLVVYSSKVREQGALFWRQWKIKVAQYGMRMGRGRKTG